MSEALPLLTLPSPADSRQARVAALRGRVQPELFEPAAPLMERRDGSIVSYSAPGIAISVDTARCTVARDAHALTVSFGGDAAAAASAVREATATSSHGAVVHLDLARKRVRLSTDRFAIRPLCYRVDGSALSFSDRADEVSPGQPLDRQALYNYLYFHVIPAPRTVFAGVSRLEAHAALQFDGQTAQCGPSWQPVFASAAPDLVQLRREFVNAIRAAVATQADDATGCFLSGGTDSSTVAGMLSRLRRGPVKAFSIGFEAEGYDEMAYARIAARHFGLDHHAYYVTADDLLRAMPEVAAHFDQPFGNSSAVPAHFCALLARSHGVTQLLAGDGGDELFGGNTRYAKQRVFDAYGLLPAALRSAVVEPIVLSPLEKLPGVRKAASYVRQARRPMPDRTAAYNLLEHIGPEQLLAPRFLAQVDRSEPLALQRDVYRRSGAASALDRELVYDWRFTLADNDLPKVTQAAWLAHVRTAFPLLDDAVVDLSLRLPPSQKVRGLRLRHFFKAALADFLPPEILRKQKHGFGLPFGHWLATEASLQRACGLALERLAARGVVRADLPQRVFGELLPRHPKFYGEVVWILTMLEHWLAAHAPHAAID